MTLTMTQLNGTATAEEDFFSTDLINPSVVAALPEGYRVRSLRPTDYDTGFLDCLRVLTTVGEISEAQFHERCRWLTRQDGSYYILVIEDTNAGRVAATGALIVERKFIHSLGSVGHIEDVAVAKEYQKKKLGQRVIESLDYIAEHVGCYKTILDCSESNEMFYEKCKFRRAGLEMAHYHDSKK